MTLEGFTKSTATVDGVTRDVYRTGSGPGVVILAEIPGITPKVAEFAGRVADRGMTAVLPHLFGTPGKEQSSAYVAQSMLGACVSREFMTMARNRTSPAAIWCRGVAKQVHEELGGPGVGAVGMCLTGGFALGMMVDSSVVAPVLSQPSLPFPFGADRKSDLGVSPDDLAVIKRRATDDGVCVLAVRFTNDSASPPERFATLQRELGDNFIGVEIDSSPGNPNGIPKSAHSVLTEELVDEPGHPTRDALDQVLDFFATRLGVA